MSMTCTCLSARPHTHAELLTVLEQHTKDRGVSDEVAGYWLSAFATNQHGSGRFDAAAQAAVNEAMGMAFGTVAVLDRQGFAMKRICVLYELHTALARNQDLSGATEHKIDIYTQHFHAHSKLIPYPWRLPGGLTVCRQHIQ